MPDDQLPGRPGTGVRRDRHGVPWVTGPSLLDVGYGQGWACAQDRAWQLDLERRRAEGRTAEMLGPAGVSWDLFARRAELAETAQRAFAALRGESRDLVAAYVDGVNDAFAAGVPAPELAELGAAPGRWEPWTPLAVFWVQHVLFGSFPHALWRHHVRRVAGDEAVELLRHEGGGGGSNAFVVGGDRTASGFPLVVGDPHRLLEDPGIYAQVRLTGLDDGFDVLGLAFVGVPGVAHFGHTGEVAWAVTNAVAAAHDLRVETAETLAGAASWTEEVPVRGSAPVPLVRRRTDHGPVVLDGPGEVISLRTPPDVLGDLGFDALPRLLRARTVADVEVAFARWVDPVDNLVAADRSGRAVHSVVGRVPARADGTVAGWVEDLPRREVGPDEVAVTANHRASAAFDRIGDAFAPPFRADRLATVLASTDRHTPVTAAAALTDELQTAGAALLDLVAGAGDLPGAARELQGRLLAWDRRMSAGSTAAALFAELRDEVVARLCATPALAALTGPCVYGVLFEPWFALPSRVTGALHTVLAVPTPFGLERDALVRDALVAVAERWPDDGATWGDRHVFTALHGRVQFGLEAPHPPATRLGGDTDCVRMTSSAPGAIASVVASVARCVWSLADVQESTWVVPLGAGGVPGGPHSRDQHDAWVAGTLLPVPHPEEPR